MELSNNLSKNLRLMRGSRTQAEFSRMLGIPRATLQAIEGQQTNIRLDTLEAICRGLNMPASALLSSSMADVRPDVLFGVLQDLDWIVSLSRQEQEALCQWLRQTLELWERLLS